MNHRNLWAKAGLAGLLLCVLGMFGSAAQAQHNDIGTYLQEIKSLSEKALAESRSAEKAGTVSDVKRYVDGVFQIIWGVPSGLSYEKVGGAVHMHGWKTQWQVNGSEFDSLFAVRYGTQEPAIGDPSKLGIVGRGRYVRKQLDAQADGDNPHVGHVLASLNNVIGWMRIDDGVTKGELQPRVDLTREWDAPAEFWLSTADTGWLHEVFSQAINILKTDYNGDVETARNHAAGLTQLIEKSINGVDANNNGSVDPVQMEGGINTALQHAGFGGLTHKH